MKSASQKRSTKAVKLLLVSSAFVLQGCRPRKDESLAQPQVVPGAQSEQQASEQQTAAQQNSGQQNSGQQASGQPNQTRPQTATGSSWGYNPFFWGYGSGYGRSWSSSSSNRSNSGFFSGSGPASHFGAKNSSYAPASHSTRSTSPTVHAPTTHSSTSHVASSPSVSHGGFGSHVSSASS